MVINQLFCRPAVSLQRVCSYCNGNVTRKLSGDVGMSSRARNVTIKQATNFYLTSLETNSKMTAKSPLKTILDLPALKNISPVTLPTLFTDKVLVYIFPLSIVEKVDPLLNDKKVEDKNKNKVAPKEASKMIRVRRHKMRKHKLKKLRRRMHFEWAKVRFRREKAKEQHFQAELLAQIREAESFDAEQYVHNVLKKIRDRPKPETKEERFERILNLRREHRSDVNVIRPKFDEDY